MMRGALGISAAGLVSVAVERTTPVSFQELESCFHDVFFHPLSLFQFRRELPPH